jgi:hypothetical protein
MTTALPPPPPPLSYIDDYDASDKSNGKKKRRGPSVHLVVSLVILFTLATVTVVLAVLLSLDIITINRVAEVRQLTRRIQLNVLEGKDREHPAVLAVLNAGNDDALPVHNLPEIYELCILRKGSDSALCKDFGAKCRQYVSEQRQTMQARAKTRPQSNLFALNSLRAAFNDAHVQYQLDKLDLIHDRVAWEGEVPQNLKAELDGIKRLHLPPDLDAFLLTLGAACHGKEAELANWLDGKVRSALNGKLEQLKHKQALLQKLQDAHQIDGDQQRSLRQLSDRLQLVQTMLSALGDKASILQRLAQP